MDDKPIVGRVGDDPPEQRPAHGLVAPQPRHYHQEGASHHATAPHTGGVILIDPRPKEPLPPLEEPPEDEARPAWLRWVAGIGLVLALVGGFVAVRALGPTPIDANAELPPMIPSMMGEIGDPEALTSLTDSVLAAPVGASVALAMRAVGPVGVPLVDTLVLFSVDTGDGTLRTARARTDEQGVARDTLVLPAHPGVTVVAARVFGSEIPSERVTVAAQAGLPASLAATGGDAQRGGAGDLLGERLGVTVADAEGNPVAGVEISFRVRSGGGLTAPTLTHTDSAGRASALWRLGPDVGGQELVATSPDIGGEVLFRATASARVVPAAAEDLSAGVIVGPVTVRASTFAIGGSHVCRLVNGAARCRGAADRGQVSGEAEARFVALASGMAHVCGLAQDGTAYCWGANESGQLGNGSSADQSTPTPVRTELRFSSLTAGAAHTCGLAGGGIPACWGLNLSGQLGDGSRNDQRGPRTVGGGLAFQSLTAGWNHTCGITASGNAFCWGLNSQGQLGDGSRLDRLVPTLVRGSVEALVAGSAHTCGIAEGRVLCWGGNAFGQLGDGTTQDRSQPVDVQGLPSAPRVLTAGAVHTCALMATGEAYCWGQNLQGQVGDGTTQNRARAVPVAGGLRFQELHAGGALTCGRSLDGVEYCWGLNGSGQIGDGTRISRTSPTRAGR